MPEEQLSLGQEAHAAGSALEEAHAELVFQVLDGAREGRLGDVQACGGATDVLLFCDGDEVMKLGDAHGTDPITTLPGRAIPRRYWTDVGSCSTLEAYGDNSLGYT